MNIFRFETEEEKRDGGRFQSLRSGRGGILPRDKHWDLVVAKATLCRGSRNTVSYPVRSSPAKPTITGPEVSGLYGNLPKVTTDPKAPALQNKRGVIFPGKLMTGWKSGEQGTPLSP